MIYKRSSPILSRSGSLRVPKFPVRKWNKEEGEGTYRSEITHQEPAGEGARERILEYEKNRAVDLREELLTEKKHTRP